MFSLFWQMNNNNQMEHKEFKKLVGSGSFSTEACVATAGTSLIIGLVYHLSCHY